jgi:hypothetical protein
MMNFYALLLIASCFSCRHSVSLETEKMLQSLLDNKEYFKLRDRLALDADKISPEKSLYLNAYVDNAFNRNELSAQRIDSLLKTYAGNMSDSTKARLLQLAGDNYFKTFQYAAAARADSDLIAHYRQVLDSSAYEDIKTTSLIRHALASVPAEQVIISANTSIPWKKDKLGLIEIPLRQGDSTHQVIFDTRANLSSITETYAKKLGLKMLDVSYEESSSITGARFKSSLGIADSLWLGDILLRHVVFQVMPDEVLFIPAPLNYALNIILGYPPIAQLKEIHILREGTMTIPAHPTPGNLNNLALDELDPIVSCKVGDDTLCFQFDTGASSSDLYDTYFHKYKADILRKGKPTTVQLGGAGGVVKREVYVIKDFPLTIGSHSAVLPQVTVQADPIPNVMEKFYGNLGQDLIGQFNEMILNFDSMYMDFK